MRYFSVLILFQIFFLTTIPGYGISESFKTVSDTETKFVIIEFPKYERSKVQELIAELNSYVGKIADVQFEESTGRMTIHYYSTLKVDDIFQIVGKYFQNFNKISGSEIQ